MSQVGEEMAGCVDQPQKSNKFKIMLGEMKHLVERSARITARLDTVNAVIIGVPVAQKTEGSGKSPTSGFMDTMENYIVQINAQMISQETYLKELLK